MLTNGLTGLSMESKILKFWVLVDEEWTQLNDVTFSISHKDVKGELGDCGKVEEKMDFTSKVHEKVWIGSEESKKHATK